MSERLAKFIARSGVCSRRAAEELIAQKRITVNGETVDSPAFNVEGNEKILLDGEKLPAVESTRLWLYYKPTGLLTTHKDTSNRPTVFDNLPAGLPRVISVGRLDLNSEGLLLLTNNGELSRTLELPQNGWSRRYKVKVHGRVSRRSTRWPTALPLTGLPTVRLKFFSAKLREPTPGSPSPCKRAKTAKSAG